jgi:membrane-associated phospholipid phosphatase
MERMSEPYLIINRILISIIVFIISLILFIGLTLMIDSSFLKSFDNEVNGYIFSLRTSFITSIMKFISNIGGNFGYIIIIGLMSIFLYLKNNFRYGIQASIILIVSSLTNSILKILIARPRPFNLALIQANNYSFPSGHAMSAIVFYGFLIYFTYLLIQKFWLKCLIILLFIVIILAIGFSRIYLGVHYPSDIIGGYLVGLSCLSLYIYIINLFYIRKLSYFN